MREVTEKLTCDSCKKTNTTSYVHIGEDRKITKAGFLAENKPPDPILDDNLYEIKPIQHMCGSCLKAVYVAMTASFSRA